jgi:gluconolactonase
MMDITSVDVLALASNFSFAQQIYLIAGAPSIEQVTFISYNDSFATNVVGDNATSELVTSLPWTAFHEGVSSAKNLHPDFTLANVPS